MAVKQSYDAGICCVMALLQGSIIPRAIPIATAS